MTGAFLKMLNMSISASWIVLAVVILRFLLKKAPKWINCLLWGIVGLRLMLPVTLESTISLIPSAEVIPLDIITSQTPSIHSGILAVNQAVNPLVHAQIAQGGNQLGQILHWTAVIWLAGVGLMQLYSVPVAPEDFFAKQGLTSDATVHELLKKRSNNFTRGLMEDPVMSEAVVPYWEMENGELTKLELLPVTCHQNENKSVSGLPVVGGEEVIFERLARLSEPYGVKMTLENGIIKCS